MSTALINSNTNRPVSAHDLLEEEKGFVESVRILLGAEAGAGFRNWFRETAEEGYVTEVTNAGAYARAMLKQRLAYLERIAKR